MTQKDKRTRRHSASKRKEKLFSGADSGTAIAKKELFETGEKIAIVIGGIVCIGAIVLMALFTCMKSKKCFKNWTGKDARHRTWAWLDKTPAWVERLKRKRESEEASAPVIPPP